MVIRRRVNYNSSFRYQNIFQNLFLYSSFGKELDYNCLGSIYVFAYSINKQLLNNQINKKYAALNTALFITKIHFNCITKHRLFWSKHAFALTFVSIMLHATAVWRHINKTSMNLRFSIVFGNRFFYSATCHTLPQFPLLVLSKCVLLFLKLIDSYTNF